MFRLKGPSSGLCRYTIGGKWGFITYVASCKQTIVFNNMLLCLTVFSKWLSIKKLDVIHQKHILTGVAGTFLGFPRTRLHSSGHEQTDDSQQCRTVP
jgi:hypothetical protein